MVESDFNLDIIWKLQGPPRSGGVYSITRVFPDTILASLFPCISRILSLHPLSSVKVRTPFITGAFVVLEDKE
jgi:hypothetical protein